MHKFIWGGFFIIGLVCFSAGVRAADQGYYREDGAYVIPRLGEPSSSPTPPLKSVPGLTSEEKINQEPVLHESHPNSKSASALDQWHFGLGVGYNFYGSINGEFKSSNSNYTSQSFGDLEGAIKLSAQARYLPNRALGYLGGVEAIFNQTDSKTQSSSLSTYTLKADLAYRLDQIYFYAGGNYSFYDFSLSASAFPANASYSYGADSGFGGAVGAGYLINNHWGVDLDYQYSYIHMYENINVSGNKVNLDLDGFVSQFSLGVKYWF
jgi:hypothetical protein